MSRSKPKLEFKRPLLKLSGEMLGGCSGSGYDRLSLEGFSRTIRDLVSEGVIPSIVLGGGNLFRGGRSHLPALKRTHGDSIGMLATLMNAICFADHLREAGVTTTVFNAFKVDSVCQRFDADKAVAEMEKGVVCLFAGGTGNPYFSTDTAAALRALEVGCDVLIKATKVDGVYSADPEKNPKAVKYDRISYGEILEKGLQVMDLMAIALCRENRLPLVVLSLSESGSIINACRGLVTGTTVIED